ncbi:YnfA family protein [Acinetobacter sp. VNH17]|uniref:YnfA family protein n=1 Tax=Acinetobacter thutiue TaxID=2998078 RepID=A0ABT7WK30_9GAMM|nr:YnfA family protein [Acinetobacter thutiue]MCY6410944.1 YnfA family protein [Acinetobacter thutiue]MDN0013046.1 YnfA family protein [Acinetobacter thutiue]
MVELSFSIGHVFKVFGLFFITAIAEILGCYFPYLILNQGKSHWLWIPTAFSLAVFVWLLTLHPAASGRIYAAYGGIYIFTALMWLRYVDQVALTRWDLFGGFIVLCGAAMVILQPQGLVR